MAEHPGLAHLGAGGRPEDERRYLEDSQNHDRYADIPVHRVGVTGPRGTQAKPESNGDHDHAERLYCAGSKAVVS